MAVERNSNRKKSKSNTTTTTTTSPSLNDSSMPATISNLVSSSCSNYPHGISFSANLAHTNESDDIAYTEKRTAHNALERQRREGLNTKFQELAHVLPALQQIRRPSKSMIVAKSLEFVSSAGERATDFQGQIHALRKENEQLMRQASLSRRRIKKRLDQDGVDQRKSPSAMTNLSCSTKRPSKLKAQSRQSNVEVINRSKKRNRSMDVVQPEPSTLPNIRKTPSPSPSPKASSHNKRRKQSNATVETHKQQHQQQQLMPTPAYHQQMAADRNAGTGLDHSVILNYPPPPPPQQRIVSSQRPRFNSHQPTTGNMQYQLQISPVVSRHNSLTLNDQIASFDFNNTAAITTTTTTTTTTTPPHQFSINHSSFGNEHVFFNAFENMVSTIPALTTPSIGQNNAHLNAASTLPSAAAVSTTRYDTHLDILESIMQNQDPTTSDNQFYQWH